LSATDKAAEPAVMKKNVDSKNRVVCFLSRTEMDSASEFPVAEPEK